MSFTFGYTAIACRKGLVVNGTRVATKTKLNESSKSGLTVLIQNLAFLTSGCRAQAPTDRRDFMLRGGRPHNVKTVLAAIGALKEKYSIQSFAISGQSGGGHLVGALLTDRDDIVCAVSTSGVLAVRQRNRALGWSTDITGYSDFYDPIDHVQEIPANADRRVFVVADPRDAVVPFDVQESYFKRVKELGHAVFLIEAKGRGSRHHGLQYAGFRIIKWCVDGVSTAEILERASSFAADTQVHLHQLPDS